ncbi:hypothetical protein HID58_007142, partial [Brassica napus]
MTKPHSSVDNSYSFSRSIPLLLMDMSADEPIILQNEVLLYAILTKKVCIMEEGSDFILTGYQYKTHLLIPPNTSLLMTIFTRRVLQILVMALAYLQAGITALLGKESLVHQREKESLALAHGGGGPRVDDLRKDGRASYLREFERRRENLHARYKERERERERQRAKDRKRIPTARPTSRDPKERTPVPKTVSRDTPSGIHNIVKHLLGAIHRLGLYGVLPSRLVDMEGDYLALDKRHPRLFVPSEFSKVVVNWPKQKLSLSMHTAVSFKHDYTEDGGVDVKYTPTKQDYLVFLLCMVFYLFDCVIAQFITTGTDPDCIEKEIGSCVMCFSVVQMILMNRSFMATGGPWDPTDGIDPSVDQSSLIKTMLRCVSSLVRFLLPFVHCLSHGRALLRCRHTKDKLHLDLSNCRHWNPFLEITVLFVPDLSECLPSFDAWKTQWLAHKKALAGKVAKDAEKKTSGDPSSAQASGTKKRVVKTPVNDEKGVARPAENEEKGSEIIVGAQTGGSSDLGAKAKEQTPSKTIVKKRIVKKVAKKKVAEVDKSMDSDSRKKVVEAGKKTPDQMKSPEEKKEEEPPRPGFILQLKRNKYSKLRSLSYVRVEDMRITIHSLGKFISHREVKVKQISPNMSLSIMNLCRVLLLESNTGRDDRILYNKLMSKAHYIISGAV